MPSGSASAHSLTRGSVGAQARGAGPARDERRFPSASSAKQRRREEGPAEAAFQPARILPPPLAHPAEGTPRPSTSTLKNWIQFGARSGTPRYTDAGPVTAAVRPECALSSTSACGASGQPVGIWRRQRTSSDGGGGAAAHRRDPRSGRGRSPRRRHRHHGRIPARDVDRGDVGRKMSGTGRELGLGGPRDRTRGDRAAQRPSRRTGPRLPFLCPSSSLRAGHRRLGSTPAARGKAILCSQQSLNRVVEDARAGMTKGHFPSDGVETRATTPLLSDGAVNNECPCHAGQRAHGAPEHMLCSTAGIRGVSVSVR